MVHIWLPRRRLIAVIGRQSFGFVAQTWQTYAKKEIIRLSGHVEPETQDEGIFVKSPKPMANDRQWRVWYRETETVKPRARELPGLGREHKFTLLTSDYNKQGLARFQKPKSKVHTIFPPSDYVSGSGPHRWGMSFCRPAPSRSAACSCRIGVLESAKRRL